MARLQIRFQGTETIVPIQGAKTTVGRSGRCTIALPDPTVADVHFRIEKKARGWRLKDDGSGIGTLVNDKPVFATTLQHGDVIRAGALVCVFLTENTPVVSEPPRAEPSGPYIEQLTPPASTPEPGRPASPREAVRDEPRGYVPEREPAPQPRERRGGLSKLIAGAALLLIGGILASYMLDGPKKGGVADALLKEANADVVRSRRDIAQAEAHLRSACAKFEKIEEEYPDSRAARTAARRLERSSRDLADLQTIAAEAKSLEGVVDRFRIDAAYARVGKLRAGAHPAVKRRIEKFGAQLEAQSKQRANDAIAAAEKEAASFLAQEQHGDALRVWRLLGTGGFDVRDRAKRGEREVLKASSGAYQNVLDAVERTEDLGARIALLEAQRESFVGTPQANALEIRISGLRARRMGASTPSIKKPTEQVLPTGPTPGTPPVKKPEAVDPNAPYADPAEIAALVKEMRYGAAAARLYRTSRHKLAAVRVEELTRLAKLHSDLAAAIQSAPAEFTGIRVRKGVRRDAAGATNEAFLAKEEGATKPYPWAEFPAKSFETLIRKAGFGKPPRLETALLFSELGLDKDADRVFLAYFKSGQDVGFFNQAFARYRGIDQPEGGFVLFGNAVVTPQEKADALLADQIEGLVRDSRSSDPKKRTAAWASLEQLGDPGVKALVASLREYRKGLADLLRRHRGLSRERAVAMFARELPPRRKHALKFILDPQAYPYPNKTAAAQKEAEDRVNKVREIWETPTKILLEKSEGARTALEDLTVIDSQLELHSPEDGQIHLDVLAEIESRLDMKHLAIDNRNKGRIEYNDAVVKYNKELKDTSVSAEERDNVRAVNDYRWMMGLECVKIDERLVRAARKHSIEMAQLEYFAHDSPTGKLKNPGLRARREGYGGGVGENIARGPATGEAAFWGWFRSSGHHRNMVRSGWRDLGCGAFANHWWTQKFGGMSGKSLNEPKIPVDPDPPGQSGNGLPAPRAPGAPGG
ncbi:MAG: FHA domain-containing protein [Planctomycetota bacterium]